MRRCLLPSPGSLRLVPLLQRYYEALRPPDSLLAALRCPLGDTLERLSFVPVRLQTQSRRIIPEFAIPVTPDPVDFRELSGSPKFPGNPHDHSPCSSTPAGSSTRYGTRGQRTRHGPRTKAQRGLPTIANFGAQSHGFWSRCLRLVVMVSHHCTQDSLPAAGPSFAGRDSNPQGFYERFLSIVLVLLSRAFLARALFWRFSIIASSLPSASLTAGHYPQHSTLHAPRHPRRHPPGPAGAGRAQTLPSWLLPGTNRRIAKD